MSKVHDTLSKFINNAIRNALASPATPAYNGPTESWEELFQTYLDMEMPEIKIISVEFDEDKFEFSVEYDED